MATVKGIAVAGSAALGLPRLARYGGPAATVILSHRFFDPKEPRARAVDRVRRQLEWLQSAYRPISVPDLLHKLAVGALPDRAVIVTTDDARLDVYEIAHEFKSFGVPLAMFVCVGWVSSEAQSADDLLAQAVSAVQWYGGPSEKIALGNGLSFELTAPNKAGNIDRILSDRTSILPHLEELMTKVYALSSAAPRRVVCNWAELRELAASGVHIGAHSMSHVPISKMSAVRQQFEITESKRILEEKIGACTSFAYPYGTPDTHDASTLAQLKAAGFAGAFLTRSDVVTLASQKFELPRIALPDTPIPLYEFKARVGGGGIPLQRLKKMVRGYIH